MLHRWFLAAIAVFAALSMAPVRGAERVPASAHGEALYLVLTDQAEQLQRLDPDDESRQSSVRAWSVSRPSGRDALDFENTFTVTLSIGGRVVASWYVNTGEGTVEPREFAEPGASTAAGGSR